MERLNGLMTTLICGACVALVSCGSPTAESAHTARVADSSDPRTVARTVAASIAAQPFTLEIAEGETAHDIGLAGRGPLAAESGMLFVFPDPSDQLFVMKDCAHPLDLLYLDRDGRIINIHAMKPEPPRAQGERAEDGKTADAAYSARLKGYPSDRPASYAVEIRGGTAARLALKPGDTVSFTRW